MFEAPKIQVTYNARLRRARVQFAASECMKARKPPASVLAKIDEKFREEKEEGHIEYWEVFAKRFDELWQHIRSLGDKVSPNHQIKFTIGQGGRRYEEMQILVKQSSQGPAYLLSCHFSEKRMASVSFNGFIFNVILKFKDLKLDFTPDRGQLRFIYLLLQNGQKVVDMPLVAQPQLRSNNERGYIVRLNPRDRYATMHLIDQHCFLDAESREKLWQKATAEIHKANTTHLPLNYLKQHTLEKLESLAHKVQGLGFNLPYDLLIAYDESYRIEVSKLKAEKAPAVANAEKEEVPRWNVRAGGAQGRHGDYFEVKTDPDAMRAQIALVNTEGLDRVRNQVDQQWVIFELQKCGIVVGYQAFLEGIIARIQQGRSLVGMKVAEGQPPQPGETPFLYMKKNDGGGEGQAKVNMREMQNPNMFMAGEQVAEVRFKEAIVGYDVFGHEKHSVGSASTAGFAPGDGVELRDDARFYATRNGMAMIEGNIIKCSEAYVHKGSVNLSSGNLYFDGAVIIQGDIEAGASVDVQGPLVVEGMIGPSQVRCTGDLDVKGGVVTSTTGWIKVGGNLRCEFLENSELEVKGDLIVQRSILHSHVVSGGNIVVLDTNQGLIAGGSVSCWGSIRTTRCGLSQGRKSECRIGSDFHGEQRVTHLKQRVEKMRDYHDSMERGLKEVMQSAAKNAPGFSEQKALMMDRVKRSAELLKKLNEEREAAEATLRWNVQSSLLVSGALDKSVSLTAAGRTVPLRDSLLGVLVVATPFRGSSIVDLKDLPSLKQNQPDVLIAEAPAAKKK